MEATSDYWKPPFYLLEAQGFEVWLVNAKDVKHLPGRPKTDKLDAVWLCKVAERQMLRPSFVPPPEIRRLRDLTRYRIDLVAAATAGKQRVEKLLEDAQIKLSVVASNVFGVSGRQMMAALVGGERDPKVLAQMARGRMRAKLAVLEEAFTGYFIDHHAFLLAKMLARVDQISADVAELDAKIEAEIAPFAQAVDRLDEIPGVGPTAAQVLVSEIGLDMARFPTPAHLASWARFAPTVSESAGKKKGKSSTGHGNPYLPRVLGEIAVYTSRVPRSTQPDIARLGRVLRALREEVRATPCAKLGCMNRRQRRGHGPPTLPPSYPGEEPWWKWAGVPRFRRRGQKFSGRQKRDMLRGTLVGSAILIVALLLIFGAIWLIQR
jgi:transposase